jgi:hypothetical protein
MTLRAGIFGVMALCFTVSPLLADEVLYCVDAASTGFIMDKIGAIPRPTGFTAERFTVKVVTDTERIISRMAGDAAGSFRPYKCHAPYHDDRISCDDGFGDVPWFFYRSSYTRAYLSASLGGGPGDPNLVVAYGTCTKF